MDWKLAIEKNHAGLVAVVAKLFMLAKWAPGLSAPGTLNAGTCRTLARVLRVAEAALRRLLVLFIRVHAITARTGTPARSPLPDFATLATGAEQPPKFNLIDPRKSLRLGWIDDVDASLCDQQNKSEAEWRFGEDAPLDPARLLRRLEALDHALQTLPVQAKRLARLIERRKQAPPGPKCVGPIRPGKPPGHRDQPKDDADFVLHECHGLVCDFSARPP